MQTWTVLLWNMALMSPGPRSAADNLGFLDDLIGRHSVDVALLNEAPVAYLRAMNDRSAGATERPRVCFSRTGTIGLDYWTDESGERKLKDRRRTTAAVLSGLGPEELGEDEVRAQSPSRAHPRRPDVPFRASRPGTWIAASVSKEHGTPREERLTCVSLYGLMDELGDASMHRSLSDVSAAFSDPTYRDLVILGGDFNIGTSLEGAELRERSRVRLEGLSGRMARERELASPGAMSMWGQSVSTHAYTTDPANCRRHHSLAGTNSVPGRLSVRIESSR